MRLVCIFLFLFILVTGHPAYSQGEHARRVAAELLIMRGDLRALMAGRELSNAQRRGLLERLYGGLSGLEILLRLADQEENKSRGDARASVGKMRSALERRQFSALDKLLSSTISSYPLRAAAIVSATPTKLRLKLGKELHETICAGCHDDPDSSLERPAYNLFEQIKASVPLEFAARMILGVRGDRVTGIDNPLSDEQIAALMAYYNSGPLAP